MSTQTLTARIDSEVLQQARNLAQQNGISLSAIINLKLREFIATKELHLTYQEPEISIDFWKEGVEASQILDFLEQNH